jgi:uridine phosphorylase
MILQEVPIFECKEYELPSVFTAENLLREARRQKLIDNCGIPNICILDPDGDMIEYLLKNGKAKLSDCWACYHTKLYTFSYEGIEFGIIGSAVGSSFAVLVAEELFATGCKLLISVTSAGVINQPNNNARFVLIDNAIRDEGTSYHYLPPSERSTISNSLLARILKEQSGFEIPVHVGTSWTTDAPFRETPVAIACARDKNAVCVEMEAAALYAFAKAKSKNVICMAHITNTMAQQEGDFEKGEEMGSIDSLKVILQVSKVFEQDLLANPEHEHLKNHWDIIYATRQEDELGWFQEEATPSLQLLEKCKISNNDLIADIGTGLSVFISDLLERNYTNIIASDISYIALEKHKQKLGSEKASKVLWIVDDITQSTELVNIKGIALWHDRAVFHFLTEPKQRQAYVQVLKKTLQKGGYLIISTFAKDGAKKCSSLNIVNYDNEQLSQLLGEEFMLLESFEYTHYTPSGQERPHLYALYLKKQ